MWIETIQNHCLTSFSSPSFQFSSFLVLGSTFTCLPSWGSSSLAWAPAKVAVLQQLWIAVQEACFQSELQAEQLSRNRLWVKAWGSGVESPQSGAWSRSPG